MSHERLVSRWSWAENFFAGGSVAPNAKCYQLLRAIGRKKCFLNSPMVHIEYSSAAQRAVSMIKQSALKHLFLGYWLVLLLQQTLLIVDVREKLRFGEFE